MSFPTASKAVQTVAHLGVVQERTGQRRNRIFAYTAYLDVQNEGGAPL